MAGSERSRRRHGEAIVARVDRRAELAQLGRHRRDAIGFLHAPARDAGQRGRSAREERHHRERHRRIGNRRAVDRPCPLSVRSRARLDPVVAAVDRRAHPGEHVGERDVALDRMASDAGDAHGTAADRARREKVRGRRRVALDVKHAGARIAGAGGMRNDRQSSCSTATPKRSMRCVVIATYGFEISSPAMSTRHRPAAARGQERQRHQQRRRELARHVAAHRDAIGRASRASALPGPIASGGNPGVAEIADVGAEQRAAHRRDRRSAARASAARPRVRSVRRRARARPSAGATPCRRCRDASCADLTGMRAALPLHDEVARCRARASTAMPSVASASSIRSTSSASSRPVRRVSPCGERRQQQRAIGDALRAGKRDHALGASRSARGRGTEPPRVARLHRGRATARAARRPRRRWPWPKRAPHSRRATRRAREHGFERGAVARRDHRGDPVELARDTRRSRAISASRLASEMSRHISGEPAAMRVKSRKPLAA